MVYRGSSIDRRDIVTVGADMKIGRGSDRPWSESRRQTSFNSIEPTVDGRNPFAPPKKPWNDGFSCKCQQTMDSTAWRPPIWWERWFSEFQVWLPQLSRTPGFSSGCHPQRTPANSSTEHQAPLGWLRHQLFTASLRGCSTHVGYSYGWKPGKKGVIQVQPAKYLAASSNHTASTRAAKEAGEKLGMEKIQP